MTPQSRGRRAAGRVEAEEAVGVGVVVGEKKMPEAGSTSEG